LFVFRACSPSPIAAFHSHVTVPLEATENPMKHIIIILMFMILIKA